MALPELCKEYLHEQRKIVKVAYKNIVISTYEDEPWRIEALKRLIDDNGWGREENCSV